MLTDMQCPKKARKRKKPKNPVKTQKKPSFTWDFTQNRAINCKKAHDAISEEKARRLPYFR